MNEDEIRKRIEVLEVRENGYLEVGNTRQANKIRNEIYKWEDLLERINGNLEKKIEKLEKQSKVIDRQAQKYFEQTIYLNKIIDLMAEKINEAYCNETSFYIWFEKAFGIKPDGNYSKEVKQYFERKVKEC